MRGLTHYVGIRLVEEGITTPIRYNFYPEQPDDIILLRLVSTPQIPEVQGHDTDMTGVQFIFRGTDSTATEELAKQVYDIFVQLKAEHLCAEGPYVIYTLCDQNVNYIGPDDDFRHEFTMYFTFRHHRYIELVTESDEFLTTQTDEVLVA